MSVIGRLSLFCLYAILMAFAQAAAATIIPVGSTPADDLIFNFNFSTSSPKPPYSQVDITAGVSGGTLPNTITQDVFGGLSGTGGLIDTIVYNQVPGSHDLLRTLHSGPFLSSGEFSVGFRIDAGAPTLDSITTTAINSAGQLVTISGVPAVPEPATFALLGVGLAGLGFSRRRKQ